MVEFRKASLGDALTIVKTRRIAWDATYRGVYPDEEIDNFDYDWHLKAEQKRLSKPEFECYLVLDEGETVGYFSYGRVSQKCRLHSLYLLPAYQGMGLGRRIFELVKAACIDAGFSGLYLDCHPDNQKALSFYRHMGGYVTHMDAGHENSMEDCCTVEFYWE